MLLGSLSRHNKDLDWRTLKPPRHVTALRSCIDHVIALRSRKDHVIAQKNQCYSSMLQLYFIQKIAGKSIFEAEGHIDPKTRGEEHSSAQERERERESERASFGSSFYMFFLFCFVFVQPGVFTWGPHSGPRTFLCSVFLGLSLLCLLAPPFWTPFPYSTCLTSS